MTLLWTTPREWVTRDPITKEKLNAISDQLTYLYNPSRAVATVRGSGSNLTYTSTTFVDIDPTYALSVELTGARPVVLELSGAVANATLGTFVYLDTFIDNSIYASSLTASPGLTGSWLTQAFVAAAIIPVSWRVTIPAGTFSAGVHTFKPRIRVSAGTATWHMANFVSQFQVGEY